MSLCELFFFIFFFILNLFDVRVVAVALAAGYLSYRALPLVQCFYSFLEFSLLN